MTKLRRERIDRDWTLEFVAQRIGITNQSVSAIETGKIKPSYDTAIKLCKLFNIEHEEVKGLFEPIENNQD